MEQNRRCDICYVEISKTNWSKHIKTKKHLDAKQAEQSSLGIRDSARREVNEGTDGVQIKRCGICNIDVNIVNEQGNVLEKVWIKHLKSHSHKRNTKLIKNILKEKVRSFNIRRQRKKKFSRY
jgi:hypothetical protein